MPGLDKRVQADLIYVSERFSIFRDQYQWFLYDFGDTRFKKDGTEKKIPGPTYHPKLSQLVSFMVEAQIKEAKAIEEIIPIIYELRDEIFAFMDKVTKPWDKTPSDKCEEREEEPS